MTHRFARRLAGLYFVGYVVAVTWPGMTFFNRVEPLVLGLPLNLVWVATWVIGGAGVLWMVHATEGHPAARRGEPPENPEGGPG
jgi:hypothetical protein